MKELIIKLLKKFRQIITCGFVSIITTCVDYVLFTVLTVLLSVPASAGQMAGYLSGTVVGYILNSNVTFREGKRKGMLQFLQYFVTDIIIASLSALFMGYMEGLGVNVYITKIIITLASFVIHFVVFKFFVFRVKKEEER